MNKKAISIALAAMMVVSSALPVSAVSEETEPSNNTESENLWGWKTIDGKKYYFRQDGTAVTQNTIIDGIRYKFSSDGVCIGVFSGKTYINGKIYYYKNGVLQRGWFTVNKKRFYANEAGIVVTKSTTIDGVRYKFGSDGVCRGTFSGKIRIKGKLYYYQKGILQKGWFIVDGKTYYAHEDGMIRTGWASISDETNGRDIYYFDKNGIWDEQKYHTGYKPNSMNEFLLDFDYPDDLIYEVSLKGGNTKFIPFEYISYVKDIIESERDKKFIKDENEGDDVVSLSIPYDPDRAILIRTRPGTEYRPGIAILKDKDGTVYYYNVYYGFGCVLDDSSVYDNLMKMITENSAE